MMQEVTKSDVQPIENFCGEVSILRNGRPFAGLF
jgi:hypothetical protein